MYGPRLLWRRNKPAIRNYAVAVVSTAVALGIARWLDVHFESAPVSLFLCAVMLSAWLGGVGPGLLAAALSATAFSYYFVSPIFALAVDSKEIPRFVMFVLASALVGSLSAAQRRSMQSLRKTAEALRETQAALAHVTRVMAMGEVLTLCQGEARKHDVELRAQLPGDLPPVRGDRVLIQQVVLNLVVNGIEAMSGALDRSREVMIRAQGEADEVRVTVRDSGIGLDTQTVARIFDALYTTKPGGLGMGLSISRTIVENHGGRLSVVAQEGPGASFEFTLPVYR